MSHSCLTYIMYDQFIKPLGFHDKIKYQKHIKRITMCNVYIYIYKQYNNYVSLYIFNIFVTSLENSDCNHTEVLFIE